MSRLLKIQVQGKLESSQKKISLKDTYNVEKDWKKNLVTACTKKIKRLLS